MPQHHFKTEVSRLLDLIIHSLYSHKEIFLRELVSNASDAIDKLRYLSVSDEAFKSIAFEPSIKVIINKEAKTIVVEDNGIGMDGESAKHVFEPFFRGPTDRHGHGLGLTIVERTARALAGSCELSSVPDRGTRITVRLPRPLGHNQSG